MIVPQENAGGRMPTPRNENVASAEMKTPSEITARTMHGPIALGRM